jgi:hypothetical protein
LLVQDGARSIGLAELFVVVDTQKNVEHQLDPNMASKKQGN